LPPEYQEIPEYFDAWNINGYTETKNATIASLLQKHKVKSVLDMSYGTGSQVFYLKDKGYDLVGSDLVQLFYI
jgi:ubiquinone/menaquinone biosynthesis C-methylase UbiE